MFLFVWSIDVPVDLVQQLHTRLLGKHTAAKLNYFVYATFVFHFNVCLCMVAWVNIVNILQLDTLLLSGRHVSSSRWLGFDLLIEA